MAFTAAQIAQLLKPVNTRRVLKDGKRNSHLSQQDVRAHLIRLFGFGAFDVDVTGPDLVFEAERRDEKTGKPNNRWDVCYRATVRLTVRDPKGVKICHYDGTATATAENQKRGDAHGLAIRSCESLALKRAATNLGDQFGLSLYNKGQTDALVSGLIVNPTRAADASADIQDNIPEQKSLGHEEDLEEGMPRNRDGSVSRSRATDEQLEANGSMTKAQAKEHGALVREVLADDKKAEREDIWTQGRPPPSEVAKFADAKLTRAQQTKLHALFNAAGWSDRADRLRALSTLLGAPVESSSDLNRQQAKTVIDVLDVVTRSSDAAGVFTDYLEAVRAGDTDEMKHVLMRAARGDAS
jgi:hypothetical protein